MVEKNPDDHTTVEVKPTAGGSARGSASESKVVPKIQDNVLVAKAFLDWSNAVALAIFVSLAFLSFFVLLNTVPYDPNMGPFDVIQGSEDKVALQTEYPHSLALPVSLIFTNVAIQDKEAQSWSLQGILFIEFPENSTVEHRQGNPEWHLAQRQSWTLKTSSQLPNGIWWSEFEFTATYSKRSTVIAYPYDRHEQFFFLKPYAGPYTGAMFFPHQSNISDHLGEHAFVSTNFALQTSQYVLGERSEFDFESYSFKKVKELGVRVVVQRHPSVALATSQGSLFIVNLYLYVVLTIILAQSYTDLRAAGGFTLTALSASLVGNIWVINAQATSIPIQSQVTYMLLQVQGAWLNILWVGATACIFFLTEPGTPRRAARLRLSHKYYWLALSIYYSISWVAVYIALVV